MTTLSPEAEARLTLLLAASGDPALLRRTVQQHRGGIAALRSDGLAARLLSGTREAGLGTRVQAQVDRAAALGARWLCPGDPDFPAWADDAVLLCVAGEAHRLGRTLAIVGSREADEYGRLVARSLGAAMAEADVAVASGAARGIDRAAHDAVLEGGGRTVAILGTGLQQGARDGAFFDAVRRRGAVVSEYLVDAGGSRRSFPERNRLIAAAAAAVVVVQAAERSGSSHTVRAARRLGRPVFAVPGDVIHPLSAGTNRLIATGEAALLAHPAGLASALEVPALRSVAWPAAPRGAVAAVPPDGLGTGLTAADRVLRALASHGPQRLDGLARVVGALGAPLPDVLLDLELKGQIRRTPDGEYRTTA